MNLVKNLRAVQTALLRSQAVVEFALDGTILFANEFFLRPMGYVLDDVQGKHHSIFISAEERKSHAYKDFWQKLRAGQFQQGQFKRIAKDGHPEWIQASYTPINDDDGCVSKIVKFATFVTEQTMQNADFAGQIRAIGSSQAVVELAMDGTILSANDRFLVPMGYSLDEVQGRHHSMLVDIEHADSHEYREFWAKLNDGHPQTAEYKRIAKTGEEVWIQASYTPILDAENKPFKIVKYATIVTEQRLAAANFAGQIEAIHLSHAVVEFSMNGIIETANDIFLDAMGYQLEEIKGQHHRIFLDPDTTDTAEYEKFWRELHHGKFQVGEYKRIDKNGSPVWLQASYTPILDLNNEPFKIVKYATVITEEILRRENLQQAQQDLQTYVQELDAAKAQIELESQNQMALARDLSYARDEAERASAAKSEFLATMSHEFRTPLNAIMGFSEMMQGQHFGPLGHENYLDYCKDIYESSQHLMSLINDLLDITAIEAGKHSFKPERMCVEALAHDTINKLMPMAQEKGVHLTSDFAEFIPSIDADRRSIVQIITNLVSNSIKYSNPKDSVCVSLFGQAGYLAIEVSDTGEGIPAEKLETITDPFVRIDDNPHITQKGTGLGLSIVRSLIEAHDGILRIESALNEGTTVTVLLPANALILLVNNEKMRA